MLSAAQLAANAANAQLSTGPRTAEGKAISSHAVPTDSPPATASSPRRTSPYSRTS